MGTSAIPTANREPPGAKQDPLEEKQESPQGKQEAPASEDKVNRSSSLAKDSAKGEQDPTKAQEPTVSDVTLAAEDTPAERSKIDVVSMEAVAAESLKKTIQPQVDALWDAVKWIEDRMEIIDADRRGELEDAARTAAQNTAKVNP